MKKLLFLLILCSLTSDYKNLMAWDTTAAKYLPLQVGNVWVYDCYSMGYLYWNLYYLADKIIGTVDTLGHTYYVYQRRIVWIRNENGYTCASFNSILRIDSASMNVYTAGICPLLDSLKARLGDTTVRCSYNYSICSDTNTYQIFNTNIPSKRFQTPYGGGGTSTIYAKDIGIVSYNWAYSSHSCNNRLKGCVINGVLRGDTSMIVGVQNIGSKVPEEFALYQNYPNPFNPVTKIRFSLPRPSKEGETLVRLVVYDILGEEIATLFSSPLERVGGATYEVEWDGTNYPSGVYYYKLESGDFSQTKKLVLVK
jgi:hypothetical protein